MRYVMRLLETGGWAVVCGFVAITGCAGRQAPAQPSLASAPLHLRLDASVVRHIERREELESSDPAGVIVDFALVWTDDADLEFPRRAPAQAPLEATTKAGRPARRVGWLEPRGEAVEWLVLPPADGGRGAAAGALYVYYVARDPETAARIEAALDTMLQAAER